MNHVLVSGVPPGALRHVQMHVFVAPIVGSLTVDG